MDKKILFSTIFVFSLLLILLGLRSPALSDGNGSQPGPQAITEDSAKHTAAAINLLKIEIACPKATADTLPVQRITLLQPAESFRLSKLVPAADLSARASPPLSHLLS